MMIRTTSASTLRRKLMLTTALAGCALLASEAQGQALPDTSSVGTVTNSGTTITSPTTQPVIVPSANRIDVVLKDQRTIINWGGTGFNIAPGNTVNFDDGRGVPVSNIAVLNRDLSGNASSINGNITTSFGGVASSPGNPSNIAVYLINTQGILFGSSANINVGALIASSLDLDAANQSAFLNSNTNLTFAGAGLTGVTVNNGTIKTDNGTAGLGQLVLLGAAITTSGATLTAGTDVSVVAGNDITMTNAGSPLSFVINAGTTVNNAVTLNGTINGRNVTFAAARPSNLTDTLLTVSGVVTATGVAATDDGIVLAAGASAPGVTVAQPSANIGVDASGATFASAKDASFATGGDLNVGSTQVDGDYSVTAATFSGNTLAPNLMGPGSDFTIIQTGGLLPVGMINAPGTLSISVLNGGTLAVNGDLSSTAEAVALSAGGITLNAPAITSAGGQTITGPVTLGTDVTLTSSGSGNITVAGSIGGPHALTVNTGGTTTFGGAVTGLTAVTTDASGTTAINGGTVSTSGAQAYGDAVTLGANTILAGTTGTFAAGVNGSGNNLTLNFTGPSTVDSSFINIHDFATGGGGATNLSGAITTSGSQTYNDAVNLAANVTLASSGNNTISFQNTVDGGNALAVNTTGLTQFLGAVGGGTPLASLTTNAGGTTDINGGLVRTTGAQTYNDAVLLTANTVLNSTGGDVSLGSTTDGAFDLTVTASGVTTFGVAVGGTTPLNSLLANGAGGTTLIKGPVKTATTQTYSNPVTLGANTVLTGTTGSFAGGVNGGGFNLTLDFSGPTTIDGSFVNINDLASGNGGTTTLSGTITTGGTQTYSDAVTLGSAVVLNSSGNKTISFGNTVDGGQALTINTTGLTQFLGAVGAGTPLASLSTDAGGATDINGGVVKTTGSQTYNDAVVLTADAALESTGGGNLGFTTIDGDGLGPWSLSLKTTGAASATGAIGGTAPLAGLGVTAGTANFALNNKVGTLAADIATGGLSFSNAQPLTVGTVGTLAGIDTHAAATSLTVGGLLNLKKDINAQGVGLTATGLSQDPLTTVDAGAGTIAIDANDGTIDMKGSLVTTNAGAAAVRIIDAGTVTLGNITTGAGGTTTLGVAGADTLNGNVGQTALTAIKTGALTGDATGTATLENSGNLVDTVKSFTAGSFSLYDGAGGLIVNGPVTATLADIKLRLGGGQLELAGDLTAANGSVTLDSIAGPVQQTGGRIKASILTGHSDGGAALTSATNEIGTLAGFTNANGGGFDLRDSIALTVSAAVDAGTNDLTLRAPGIAFGSQTLTAGRDVLLDAGTSAVSGPTGTVAGGRDVTAQGGGIDIGTATATAGTLALTASSGQLTLGTGGAGGVATLTKTGATGELQVTTSLTSGGDATINSSTHARLAKVTSSGGNIVVNALAGEVTGVGAGGRADLAAQGNSKNVTVRAGTLALLGTVTAGQDLAVTAGSTTPALNGSIDIGAASGRDIALAAVGGSVAAGTVSARDDIAIRATTSVTATTLTSGATIGSQGPVDASGVADALVAPEIPAVTLAGNDIDVRGSAVAVGTATANGSGSDLRLRADTGQLTLGTGTAGGTASLTKTGATGELQITTSLTSAGDATINSSTAARLASVTSTAGNITATAATDATGGTLAAALNTTLTAGQLAQFSSVGAGLNASIGAGTAVIGTASANAGSLTISASSGQLTLGTGAAGGVATLTKTGATGELQVTTSLTSGGDATINSSTHARLAKVTSSGGNIVVNALAGEVTGVGAGGRADLAAQGNSKNVTVRAGTLALLGTVTAGQDLAVTAGSTTPALNGSIDIGTASGRDVALAAVGGSVAAGTVSARDDIAIRATTSVTATTLTSGATIGSQGPVDASGVADALVAPEIPAVTLAGNDIDVRGSAVAVGTAIANGSSSDLRLTASTGQLTLGTGSAGQDMTLRALAGSAQIGSAATARNLIVDAIDVDLATAASAASAQFTNLGTGPLRLGTSGAGFSLSVAEVNRISAANVTFQSGSRDVELGALPLAGAVGSTRLDILTTGRIDVIGAVSTAQTATTRTIQLGGSASGIGQASVIAVDTTRGGRLLMGTPPTPATGSITGGSQLDLRGQRIGVGQTDLLTALGLASGGSPVSPGDVAANYVGNAASRLYNPSAPTSADVVTAYRLTVSYDQYALFQNTAPGGEPRGAALGSLGVTQTLQLNSSGSGASNGFALFGRINDRGGSQAAVLGPTVNVLNGANPNNTRINGCLVGSGGGGCLISAVSTPPVNIFDQSRADLIRTSNELPLSFDPVVGANNEALFSGLEPSDQVLTQPDCRNAPENPACPATRKDHP